MTKEQEALENFVRTSVWNDDEFHEIWDNGNQDLELLKKGLARLAKYDEILSKPKLTNFGTALTANGYTYGMEHKMYYAPEYVVKLYDKLRDLEDVYWLSKEEK